VALAAGVLDAAVLALVLVFEFELPHAATNRAASTAIRATAPRRNRGAAGLMFCSFGVRICSLRWIRWLP
jgi:hypothetical protein